jgi:multidrug efflux pump subunit AcrA (membrane-fusion protein)
MQIKHMTLAGCLCLTTLLLAGCFGGDAEATPTPRPFNLPAVTQSTLPTSYVVARGDVVDELRFTGNVDLAQEEEIFFTIGGRLAELSVEHGAVVQAGAPVAMLDDRSQQFDLEDAQLLLTLAEGRLAQQATDADAQRLRLELAAARERLRLEQLQAARNTTPGAIAIQEIAVRLAEFEQAHLDASLSQDLAIEVDRARLRLARAATALADTRATAPITGQVLLLEGAEVGAQVAAYAPFAVVIDPESVFVSASLPAETLRTLREGIPVTIHLGEVGVAPAVAGVIQALPAPYGAGQTQVEIAATDPVERSLLQPGATVQVVAERERKQNVLWVPPSALQGFRDAYFVRLADGAEVPVTIGLQNNQQVEILSGLTEGQTVLGR